MIPPIGNIARQNIKEIKKELEDTRSARKKLEINIDFILVLYVISIGLVAVFHPWSSILFIAAAWIITYRITTKYELSQKEMDHRIKELEVQEKLVDLRGQVKDVEQDEG